MTDRDRPAFGVEFRRLSSALESSYRKVPESEVETRIDSYFAVLQAYSLRDVTNKAEQWLKTETRFPKPTEWANAFAKAAVVPIPEPGEDDKSVWLEAERRGYEARVCSCRPCKAAGITELQPIRFVPEFVEDNFVEDNLELERGGDGYRDKHVRIGNRVVTAGHWAHGEELVGYYRAKAAFWARCAGLFGMESIAERAIKGKTMKRTGRWSKFGR